MDLKTRIEEIAVDIIHPVKTAVDNAIAEAKQEFAVSISSAESAGASAVSALESRVKALEEKLSSGESK